MIEKWAYQTVSLDRRSPYACMYTDLSECCVSKESLYFQPKFGHGLVAIKYTIS